MGRKLKGSVFKDGEHWYFRLFLRSKKRYSAKIPPRPSGEKIDRKYADRYAQTQADRYRLGLWDPETPAPPEEIAKAETVRAFAASWLKLLTNANAAGDRRMWDLHLANKPLCALRLEEVRPRHVRELITVLKETPAKRGGKLSARTVRNLYSLVQRLFAFAVEQERIAASPCQGLRKALPKIVDKVPGARRGWVRTASEVRLLTSDLRVPADRRVLYALEFYTGARFSELAVVRWDDIVKREPLDGLLISKSRDMATKEAKSTKTGVPREVPVHPELRAILTAWWEAGWQEQYGRAPKCTDLVVPSRRLESRDVRNNWDRYAEDCDRLSIPRRRQHDSRRTFISQALAGGARSDVLEWITHDASAASIMNLYTTLPWQTLCAAVLCLRYESPPPPSAVDIGRDIGSGSAD